MLLNRSQYRRRVNLRMKRRSGAGLSNIVDISHRKLSWIPYKKGNNKYIYILSTIYIRALSLLGYNRRLAHLRFVLNSRGPSFPAQTALPKACPSGKIAYATPAEANAALAAMNKRSHRRPKQWMRGSKPCAYRCPMCGAWHVSSGRKPQGRPA